MNFTKMLFLFWIVFISMPIFVFCRRIRQIPTEISSSAQAVTPLQSTTSKSISYSHQYRNNKEENLLNGIQLKAALIECPDRDDEMPKEEFNCEDKIMVTIHMKPEFGECPEGMRKVLIIDEVFDTKTKSRAKLMSPYMIEILTGDLVLMYPLEFLSVSLSITCLYLDYYITYFYF